MLGAIKHAMDYLHSLFAETSAMIDNRQVGNVVISILANVGSSVGAGI
jgi:hypothetical protein